MSDVSQRTHHVKTSFESQYHQNDLAKYRKTLLVLYSDIPTLLEYFHLNLTPAVQRENWQNRH